MQSSFHIVCVLASLCRAVPAQEVPGYVTPDPRQEWQTLMDDGRQAYRQKRFAEAEQHMRGAIQLAERLGLNDDRLASVLCNLGLLWLEQGRAKDAERPLERAVNLYRACGARCASGAAMTLRTLANARRRLGRFTSAEQLVEEGLAKIRYLPKARGERARLLDELSSLRIARDQPRSAADLLRRALDELRGEPLEPDYRPQLYQSLATALYFADDFSGAQQACRRALELVDVTAVPQLAAAVHFTLGSMASELGRFAEAEQNLTRAHHLLSAAPDTSVFELWPVAYAFGDLEMRRGNFVVAEPQIRRAISLLESIMPPGHPDFMKVRARYALLLRKLNRKKEAARIESELRSLWNKRDTWETDSHTVDARDLRRTVRR
jgi:tetratricopeptide (TPR) repeat protein